MFCTDLVFAQDILLSKQVPLSPVSEIKPESLKEDIDVLVNSLDKAYGGKDILTGNQYAELIASLKKLKESSKNLSSEEFCEQIAQSTEKVNDSHLTVHIGNKTCQRKWPIPSVGPNSGSGSENPTWSLAKRHFNGHTISVLSIQKMSPSASPDWNGFLEEVQKLVQAGNSFVIDMRSNPGGDSARGVQMAALLYGVNRVDEVPMPQKTIYRVRTPEAWSVVANVFWLEMQKLSSLGKPVPNYITGNYQEMVSYRDKALQGLVLPLQVDSFGSEKVNLSRAFQSPIYVLIDRNCGSSCELTLEALEKLPSVQTVGENTTGVVQFGNVGALYLPNSHLVIRMPTQGAVYADGRLVEKIGYSPKWKVPPGTDALDYTLVRFFQ